MYGMAGGSRCAAVRLNTHDGVRLRNVFTRAPLPQACEKDCTRAPSLLCKFYISDPQEQDETLLPVPLAIHYTSAKNTRTITLFHIPVFSE